MDMKISPSMLACDFANMGAEANKCAAGGAHLLHLDCAQYLFWRAGDRRAVQGVRPAL